MGDKNRSKRDKTPKETREEGKFRVNIWEYERGWGSKIDSTEKFDTKELAIEFIVRYNAINTASTVPDWYMVAKPDNFEYNV